ncbi:uncharacterized protein [Eucyclogobius newberryi]|uniref:uncharacterized protein isoform X1 n=2 Tax=Eucyclogobius newberryi TaxID=166745 RepID=UPI003B5CB2A4
MAEVKLKEETELWEPRGPCGSWGPAEDTHGSGVEPAHLKEEEPELCIKQEPQEFPLHMVSVKSEEDEDKSSVLHQRATEENREETNVTEAGCSSDPLTQFHSDSEEHTDSSEDTEHSEDYSQQQAPKRSYVLTPRDASGARVKKSFSCSECGKMFTNHCRLQTHMMSHTGEKPHKCSECGKSFEWRAHLGVHMLGHTGEKPHKCPVCEKAFTQKGTLTKHLRTQHHVCTICLASFPDDTSLNEHLKTHIEEGTLDPSFLKSLTCSECGKEFRWKSDLHTHMLVHTGERPHKCPICEKDYKHKYKLERHMKTHDTSQTGASRPFGCSDCGLRFGDKSYLRVHMLSHTGERPHKCPECGKGFRVTSNLRRHMSVHTGHRPHKCPFCQKGFIEKFYLEQHMRVHSGEKPFVCSVCGKSFRLKAGMEKHMKAHCAEKPFECSVCDKCFKYKSGLTRHMSIKHGTNGGMEETMQVFRNKHTEETTQVLRDKPT